VRSPRSIATNGRLCVGNGTTAVAAGQTDLQGASKTRKVFDAAPTVSAGSWTVVTTFTTADANHDWAEAGIANAASGGVLFNRALVGFGVKSVQRAVGAHGFPHGHRIA
jgi:hypothetical protein